MSTTSVIDEKAVVVERLKKTFQNSQLAVVADYRGLTTNKINQLRKELFNSNTTAAVCKNTLARRALNELNISFSEEMFIGPSLVINTNEDAVKTSKTVVEFAKQNERLVIKGGFLNAVPLTLDEIKHLASLPGREELIAKIVGTIKAPLTRLVGTLSSPINSFVNVLRQIEKQKSGGE